MQITNVNGSISTHKLQNEHNSPSFMARIHICTEDEFIQHQKELNPERVGPKERPKLNMEEAKTGIKSAYTIDATICSIGSVINRKAQECFLAHLHPDENLSKLPEVQDQIKDKIEELYQDKNLKKEKLEGFITGAKCRPEIPELKDFFGKSIKLYNTVKDTFKKIGIKYSTMAVQTKPSYGVSLLTDSENGVFYLLIQDENRNAETSPEKIAEDFMVIDIAEGDRVTNLKNGHLNDITEEIKHFKKLQKLKS